MQVFVIISKGGIIENVDMNVRNWSKWSLPLYKTLKPHMLTAIVRSVFEEVVKYYAHVFLDEYLYEL